ncbi:MAG: hypothetical protein IJU11_05495 [Prevotella sp.]|nr:hypothetical protein [Prevotella sp.]
MANKKSLKRTINLICEDLLVECIAASLYGHNRDCAESLFYSTIKLQRDFISRISHPEPGMPQKKYFKVLKGEFVAHVSDIIDQINL